MFHLQSARTTIALIYCRRRWWEGVCHCRSGTISTAASANRHLNHIGVEGCDAPTARKCYLWLFRGWSRQALGPNRPLWMHLYAQPFAPIIEVLHTVDQLGVSGCGAPLIIGQFTAACFGSARFLAGQFGRQIADGRVEAAPGHEIKQPAHRMQNPQKGDRAAGFWMFCRRTSGHPTDANRACMWKCKATTGFAPTNLARQSDRSARPTRLFPATAICGSEISPDPGVPRGITGPDKNNFAPRFGFAWDVLGNGRTSVRGSVGIFYDSIKADAISQEGAPWAGNFQLFN